ncbi:anchored repeat ABC transporter, substrate-binding protein [Trueperella pecoris]|uniref:Anchored repeat ABC transporter, substrate-binding protein n=1 Tax=Trueperella pecoris TaxID=2733571 RepID=A0A7M1QUK4_9ACTO|nr:anchored repeat ABC transporter, substrate-binding protein [Trueperella pecoris]QOQ38672.1 anchored repeat ABC transporter, substrate-binding protein [Trueperella pecoris]QOR44837.1 anchored repeat ABC transporter, substrate-binding protein [Trueperella pecoris]
MHNNTTSRGGLARPSRLLLAVSLVLTGCALPQAQAGSASVVVATTPIVADMVKNVAGEAIDVVSLVPPTSDPHTYEPPLSMLRQVTRAKAAFSNGLLLENTAIREMVSANLPEGSPLVELGDESVAMGAYHIPLVEDRALDTVWLGLRVEGKYSDPGVVTFRAIDAKGPGHISAFTTGVFGQPSIWLDSSDGLGDDELSLPLGSHTHMSWGFTKPGHYQLTLEALHEDKPLSSATIEFAVGVDAGPRALATGHVDLLASLDGNLRYRGEEKGKSFERKPVDGVVAVPHATRTQVPADPKWRFLGKPGDDAWVLAQAVIGKHVHGEVDPHMWLDARNAIAFAEIIQARLSTIAPEHAQTFQENAKAYIARLEKLNRWMANVLATIPKKNRRLVTAHDAYGYLANAYGLTITGFASANPSLEPSAGQLAILSATLRDLGVPAVFTERSTRSGRGELTSIADGLGIEVCSLSSDTLMPDTPTYVDLMIANTNELKKCLDPGAYPAWKFEG